MTMTKAERIEVLEELQADYGCSRREALEEIIFQLFTSKLAEDVLEKEVKSMTDDQLLKVYLDF